VTGCNCCSGGCARGFIFDVLTKIIQSTTKKTGTIKNMHAPGGVKNGKFVTLTHFKKIGLNLDQHKVSLLLNSAIVPPLPKTKKLCIFSIKLFIICY